MVESSATGRVAGQHPASDFAPDMTEGEHDLVDPIVGESPGPLLDSECPPYLVTGTEQRYRQCPDTLSALPIRQREAAPADLIEMGDEVRRRGMGTAGKRMELAESIDGRSGSTGLVGQDRFAHGAGMQWLTLVGNLDLPEF